MDPKQEFRLVAETQEELKLFMDGWRMSVRSDLTHDWFVLSYTKGNISIAGRLYTEKLISRPKDEIKRCLLQMSEHLDGAGCGQ